MKREHLTCTEPEPRDWELSSCWPRWNISNKGAIDLSNSSFYCCCFLVMCKTMKDIHFGLSRRLDKVEANRESPSFSVYFKWLNRNLYKSRRTTTAIEKKYSWRIFLVASYTWGLQAYQFVPIHLLSTKSNQVSSEDLCGKYSKSYTRTIITVFYSTIAFAKI